MNKIGIITLSASDNCGSLLQCYALKQILAKYGDVEVLNFSSQSSHDMYDIFPKKIGIKEKIARCRKMDQLITAKKGYDDFRKKYLDICGSEFYAGDLWKIKDKYDVIVAGSDQVWNVRMSDYDDAFFMGWTTSKKIAYAPSLGGSHLKYSDCFEQIKIWISDISYLSVREQVGKECLEEVTGKSVPKVLDPTLVLEEKEWLDIVGEPLVDGEYIFYYSWAYRDESTLNIVTNTSKKNGLPVYVMDARKWIHNNPKKYGFDLYKENGPLVFLNLMRYAKYCYVESFHGMVFAYIFKKDFWLMDSHKNIEELDVRLMEFVSLLGAEDRILTQYNEAEVDQKKQFVYKENTQLIDMRKKSVEFLNSAFCDGDL